MGPLTTLDPHNRDPVTLVWRYKLLFDIFDVDRIGKITMAELDAMLRMLYGSLEADSDLLKMLAINGNGDEDALTFDEFCEVGLICRRRSTRWETGVSNMFTPHGSRK